MSRGTWLVLLAVTSLVMLTGAASDPTVDNGTLQIPMGAVIAGLAKLIWDLKTHITRSNQRHDHQEAQLDLLRTQIDDLTAEIRRLGGSHVG